MSLRERGIYCLPNGRELIVLEKTSQEGATFRLGGWGHFELAEYVIDNDGRLRAQGRLTAWDISDLTDTGRTAH